MDCIQSKNDEIDLAHSETLADRSQPSRSRLSLSLFCHFYIVGCSIFYGEKAPSGSKNSKRYFTLARHHTTYGLYRRLLKNNTTTGVDHRLGKRRVLVCDRWGCTDAVLLEPGSGSIGKAQARDETRDCPRAEVLVEGSGALPYIDACGVSFETFRGTRLPNRDAAPKRVKEHAPETCQP